MQDSHRSPTVIRISRSRADSPACSFCQRVWPNGDHQLLAGPDGVFICDECIALCAETLNEETST